MLEYQVQDTRQYTGLGTFLSPSCILQVSKFVKMYCLNLTLKVCSTDAVGVAGVSLAR